MLLFILGALLATVFCITYYERRFTKLQLDALGDLAGQIQIVADDVDILEDNLLGRYDDSPLSPGEKADNWERHLTVLKDLDLIHDDTVIVTELNSEPRSTDARVLPFKARTPEPAS